MNLSYWEQKKWLQNIDFTIVGSGIVGLSSAVFLKQRFPKAKILVLEKGFLPQGASTKNAAIKSLESNTNHGGTLPNVPCVFSFCDWTS